MCSFVLPGNRPTKMSWILILFVGFDLRDPEHRKRITHQQTFHGLSTFPFVDSAAKQLTIAPDIPGKPSQGVGGLEVRERK
jgi:hypothetical protein